MSASSDLRVIKSLPLWLILVVLVVPVPGLTIDPVSILASAPNASEVRRTTGQVIYVPVYSHIYYGDREASFLLAATVLVRNTDPRHSIVVSSADYHDSDGKLLQRYLAGPLRIPPLASTRFVIPESDTVGGSGASVLVAWKAMVPVNAPIVESIMIGTQNQQGISFTSRGQVLAVTPGDVTSGPSPLSSATVPVQQH